MNFLEAFVLHSFEEQLSLPSEDLNMCMNTASLQTHNSKGPPIGCFGRNPFGKAEWDQAPTCRHC